MYINKPNLKFKNALGNRKTTKYIVLHHAAAKNCNITDIHQWHLNNGWSGCGYHFFVDKKGNIFEGRPLYTVGAHVSGQNSISVGICAEGDYSIEKGMPGQQQKAIAELIAYLKNVFPTAHIVGHKELGATACPGQFYPLEELKSFEEIVKGDESMEKIEKELKSLQKQIDDLKRIHEVAEDIVDVPLFAQETIKKLVRKDILKGTNDGSLHLTEDMIRILVLIDRMGLID